VAVGSSMRCMPCDRRSPSIAGSPSPRTGSGASVQAAGRGPRIERHHHTGDSHRRRGRMVLADTLCLAARVKPRAIIDYATLTARASMPDRTLQRRIHESARTARRDRSGRQRQRRARVVLSRGQGLRLRSGKHGGGRDAMRGRGQGRPYPGGPFLSRFVPKTIPCCTWISPRIARRRLAHIATDITGFGVRFTIELIGRGWPFADAATRRSGRGGAPARGAAAAGRRALSREHAHDPTARRLARASARRGGAARGGGVHGRALRRAIVMPNLKRP